MDLEVNRGKVKAGKATRQSVARIVDREAGVVCYMFSGKDSVTAVPLSETNLD
jgi:hypothetical protein